MLKLSAVVSTPVAVELRLVGEGDGVHHEVEIAEHPVGLGEAIDGRGIGHVAMAGELRAEFLSDGFDPLFPGRRPDRW